MRKSPKKNERGRDLAEVKARMLQILTRHVGAHKACDMGRLYEQVYDKAWRNKINDSRKLRDLVTSLREEGVAICSSSSCSRGGYYLAATAGELDAFLQRNHDRALKILNREAKMRELPLAELLSRMRLDLTGSAEKEALNG